MAQTRAELLQLAAERQALQDLVFRYSHCVAKSDVDAIVNLYAPDGMLEGPAGTARGHEQLRALYTKATRYPAIPFVHNLVIDYQGGDRARGFSCIEIRVGRQNWNAVLAVAGEDEFVKLDGQWKFAARRGTMSPLVPPPAPKS